MKRTLTQMQAHRPVIRNCVDNMSESGMDGSLTRPNMSGNKRCITRKVMKNRSHKLGCFLVAGVIRKFFKALSVERVPDKPVKKP